MYKSFPNKNAYLREFDSATEYIDFAASDRACGVQPHLRTSRRPVSERADFFTFPTWDVALEHARKGWADGLARVAGIAERIGAVAGQKVARPTWQLETQGLFVDVAEYLTGAPECFWNEADPAEVEGTMTGAIKISVAGGGAGNVGPAEKFMRGAAILALVDLLENAGRRVEVEIGFSTADSGKSVTDIVQVKAASSQVDRDGLAFWLAAADSQRRIRFSAIEIDSFALAFIDIPGYGHTQSHNTDADFLLGPIEAGDPAWKTEATAAAWVIRTAKQQGVIFED